MQPIKSSYGRQRGVPLCTLRHSHHNLPEIFHLAWQEKALPRGSFADIIFRLIAFHQSLAVLSAYPPKKELEISESNRYCEPEFLKVYAILVIADSTSYSVFDPEEAADKRNEIFENAGRLTGQWEEGQNKK